MFTCFTVQNTFFLLLSTAAGPLFNHILICSDCLAVVGLSRHRPCVSIAALPLFLKPPGGRWSTRTLHSCDITTLEKSWRLISYMFLHEVCAHIWVNWAFWCFYIICIDPRTALLLKKQDMEISTIWGLKLKRVKQEVKNRKPQVVWTW